MSQRRAVPRRLAPLRAGESAPHERLRARARLANAIRHAGRMAGAAGALGVR